MAKLWFIWWLVFTFWIAASLGASLHDRNWGWAVFSGTLLVYYFLCWPSVWDRAFKH